MLKLPKLSIFAFVFCAILAAAGIHHFTNRSQEHGSISLGSQDDPHFQFEQAAKCSKDRLYLETGLAKLPPIYRDERVKKAGDFPRACVTYIMNKQWAGAESTPSSALAICKTENGRPQSGALKACVTETYVNTIYNYFTDIFSCLGIPQRDFLAKLYNESGLHMNALGRGFDAGVAQLVGPAIEHAKLGFPPLKREVLNSTHEACQRLSPYISKLSAASSSPDRRCEIISLPNNPLLNIFTMAIKYRQDLQAIQNFMARPEFDIINRLEKLGLKQTDYDREQLLQILITLGYNAGAKTAVIGISNYLKAVEQTGRTLSKADFDVNVESLIYSAVNAETLTMVRRVPKDDDDERWKARVAKFEERLQELGTLNLRYKPTARKVTLKHPKKGNYQTYKLDLNPGELSFSAYMQLYQTSGAGGYLNFVSRTAKELNQVFAEGTCVPESYLAL